MNDYWMTIHSIEKTAIIYMKSNIKTFSYKHYINYLFSIIYHSFI